MFTLKKPEVIFFDWDGTIVENDDFIESLADALFLKFPPKNHQNAEDFKKIINMTFRGGVTARDSVAYLYGKTDYNIDEILHFITNGGHGFIPKVSVREGVIDLIRLIYDKKITMCIVSNRDSISLKEEVTKLELNQYFSEVVSFDTVDKPKPMPDIVYHAIRLLNKDKKLLTNCWLIGDTIADINCALNAGLIPFFVGKNETITQECIEKINNKEANQILNYQELIYLVESF